MLLEILDQRAGDHEREEQPGRRDEQRRLAQKPPEPLVVRVQDRQPVGLDDRPDQAGRDRERPEQARRPARAGCEQPARQRRAYEVVFPPSPLREVDKTDDRPASGTAMRGSGGERRRARVERLAEQVAGSAVVARTAVDGERVRPGRGAGPGRRSRTSRWRTARPRRASRARLPSRRRPAPRPPRTPAAHRCGATGRTAASALRTRARESFWIRYQSAVAPNAASQSRGVIETRSRGAPGRRWPRPRRRLSPALGGQVGPHEPPDDGRERNGRSDTDPGQQERVVRGHRRDARPDGEHPIDTQRDASAGELTDQGEQGEPRYLGRPPTCPSHNAIILPRSVQAEAPDALRALRNCYASRRADLVVTANCRRFRLAPKLGAKLDERDLGVRRPSDWTGRQRSSPAPGLDLVGSADPRSRSFPHRSSSSCACGGGPRFLVLLSVAPATTARRDLLRLSSCHAEQPFARAALRMSSGRPALVVGLPRFSTRAGAPMRNLVEIPMSEHDAPTAAGKIAERSVAFTVLGVAVAFALVALPAPSRNYGELAAAAGLGVALIALSLCWRRIPRTTQLVVPLGFLVLAALLRLSDGGSASGFAGLYILAILWLALSGRPARARDRADRARSRRDRPADRDRRPAVPGPRLAADRRAGLGRDDRRVHDPQAARRDARASARGDALVAASRVAERGRKRARDRDRAAAAPRPGRRPPARPARCAGRGRAAPRRIGAASLRRGRGSRRAGLSRRARAARGNP